MKPLVGELLSKEHYPFQGLLLPVCRAALPLSRRTPDYTAALVRRHGEQIDPSRHVTEIPTKGVMNTG